MKYSSTRWIALLGAICIAACASDPRYVQPTDDQGVPVSLEVNAPGSMNATATETVDLPIRLELDPEETDKRAALALELGLTAANIPYVKRGDLSVSVEWVIKNISDTEGSARIHLNGGNEWVAFVPANFVVDPEEDEEPPPLLGDVPYTLSPGEVLTGVFREDEVDEASVDLEFMSRGGINPIAAVLQTHRQYSGFTIASGALIPAEIFAGMVRFELTFLANTHMVLEFAIRVRDHRGILHDDLLNAAGEELTVFAPVDLQPPMMTP